MASSLDVLILVVVSCLGLRCCIAFDSRWRYQNTFDFPGVFVWQRRRVAPLWHGRLVTLSLSKGDKGINRYGRFCKGVRYRISEQRIDTRCCARASGQYRGPSPQRCRRGMESQTASVLHVVVRAQVHACYGGTDCIQELDCSGFVTYL
jgi:hypothetical protein